MNIGVTRRMDGIGGWAVALFISVIIGFLFYIYATSIGYGVLAMIVSLLALHRLFMATS